MSRSPPNPTGNGGFENGKSGIHRGRPPKTIGDPSAEKKAVTKTAPPGVVEVTEPLENFGGSKSDTWNDVIACQVVNALWVHPETRDKQIRAALAGLSGIGPKDELEGMMAAQMVAAHNAAMECHRRAMLPDQTTESRRENLAQANKLSRSFVTLVEALNRHRGKGQQKMTVEHVHVYPGGKAVVGVVGTPEGGDPAKIEDRCDARQIADAPQPEMWGPLSDHRTAVPSGGDGEWPLPHARRPIEGRSEG